MTPPKPPHRDVRTEKHPPSAAPDRELSDEDTGAHDVDEAIPRATIRTRLDHLEVSVQALNSRFAPLEAAAGKTLGDTAYIRGQLDLLVGERAAEHEERRAVAVAAAQAKAVEATTRVETAKLELEDRRNARDHGLKRWQVIIAMVAPVVAAATAYYFAQGTP